MPNNVQIKSFLLSLIIHAVIIGILLVGPAFVPKQPRIPETIEIIDFFPLRTTDRDVKGGGEPTATPPLVKPQPTPQTIQHPLPPQPTPSQNVTTPQQTVKTPQETPQTAPEPSSKPQQSKKTITINTNLVTKKITPQTTENVRTSARDRTSTTDRLDPEILKALQNLRSALGSTSTATSRNSSTTSTTLYGPGGGGIPYANFRSAVYSIYYNAWNPPASISQENAITEAEIIVARDGSVLSAKIIKSSGVPEADASVQRALDRVRKLPPLPEESKESQRTLRIKFDLKAKRELS